MWLLHDDIKISDSGLFDGFTDYHCHLLPGVDDGVKTLTETWNLLNLWESLGVRNVYLTPHIMEDVPNTTSFLRKQFEIMSSEYKGKIKLHLSAENMLDRLFNERLTCRDLLPLGDDRHILVETSYYNPPYRLKNILESILQKGFFPVLAHPERYLYMSHDDYRRLKSIGIKFQLNVPSLVGVYGELVTKRSEFLLMKDLYDLCGTDTHNMRFVKSFLECKIRKKILRKCKALCKTKI